MMQTYMFDTKGGYQDLAVQREFCSYILHGFDPYAYRGAENPPASELGLIYNGFHATPWGSLLQNVFYAGFLPFRQAKIWLFVVSYAVLLIVSYLLWLTTSKLSSDFGMIAAALSLTSIDILMSLHMGNAGFAICAATIISCVLCDEHPYIAGLSLGFAMIKPQTAGLVCIMFLLMKKFVPLVVAAVIDIAAWLGTSLLVNKNMLELLREFFLASKHTNMPKAGLFSMVFENQYLAIALSMPLGLLFVIALWKLMPRDVPTLFKTYPALIASSFWSYSNISAEDFSFILPAILCLWLSAVSLRYYKRLLWLLSSAIFAYGAIIRSVIRKALFVFFNIPLDHGNIISKELPHTIYEIAFIVLGVLITLELRKIYREAA